MGRWLGCDGAHDRGTFAVSTSAPGFGGGRIALGAVVDPEQGVGSTGSHDELRTCPAPKRGTLARPSQRRTSAGSGADAHRPRTDPEGRARTMDILRIIASIFIPPLGVFLQEGLNRHFWINVVLTLFGYIPGIIHALYIIVTREPGKLPHRSHRPIGSGVR